MSGTALELIAMTIQSTTGRPYCRARIVGVMAAHGYLWRRRGLDPVPMDVRHHVDKCELYRDELLRQVANANGREKAR